MMRALRFMGAAGVILTVWMWAIIVLGDLVEAGAEGLSLIAQSIIKVAVAGYLSVLVWKDWRA